MQSRPRAFATLAPQREVASRVFGWLLAAAGLVPLYLAARAIGTGRVTYGDRVRQRSYERAEQPAAFWAGVVFYVLLGIGLIVAGVLAGFGVIA